MAYELLTGLPPFSGRTAQAVLAAQVVEEPEPVERRRPAVPPMLGTLVRECLCKRPADRPQSALQVMHVLDAMATPSGGTTATTAVRLPATLPARHSRRKLVVAASGAVLLLLAGLVWYWGNQPGSGPPAPAAVIPAVDSGPAVAQEESVAPPRERPEARRGQKAESRRRTAPTPPVAAPVREEARPILEQAPAESLRLAAPTTLPDSATLPAPAPVPEAPAPPSPPAAATPRTPPAQVDQRPAIRNQVAEYADAIEARSLDALRRVYPAMTGLQQRGWEQFFQLVRDVQADLSLSEIQVTGASAQGLVTGAYKYLNTSTGRPEHQPVSFQASFRSEGGKWRLVEVR
jgi:hypothetical protein